MLKRVARLRWKDCRRAGSKADSVDLSGGTGIVSGTIGKGRSGDVTMHAKTVSLMDGAVIKVGDSGTTVAAGNVTIDADSVDISGGSRISSQAVGPMPVR